MNHSNLSKEMDAWLNQIFCAGALVTRSETREMLEKCPDPSHPEAVEIAAQVDDPKMIFAPDPDEIFAPRTD